MKILLLISSIFFIDFPEWKSEVDYMFGKFLIFNYSIIDRQALFLSWIIRKDDKTNFDKIFVVGREFQWKDHKLKETAKRITSILYSYFY